MNYETRVTIGDQVGRIKILPANPCTARGFSGDLILDEFAFHDDSTAIWEAAEPILSAHPDYLCRIASTPHGPSQHVLPPRHRPRRPSSRPRQTRLRPELRMHFRIRKHGSPLPRTHLRRRRPSAGLVCDDQWSSESLTFLGSAGVPPNSSIRSPQSAIRDLPMVPGRIYALEPDPSECADTTDTTALSQLRGGAAASPAEFGVPPNSSLASRPSQTSLRTSTFGLRTFFVGVDVGRSQDLTVISVLEKEADSSTSAPFSVSGICGCRRSRNCWKWPAALRVSPARRSI